MHREKGHIDILKLLGIELSTVLDGTDEADYNASLEIYDKLCSNDKVHILKHELGLRILFSFEYCKETYFFKYESLTNPLNELFAYEVANRLGIEAVAYDLAVLGPYKGVISKDFKNPTFKYVEGLDVLIDAYPEYLKDYSSEPDEKYRRQCILRDYCELNSLESIWNAFSIRYKDRIDCEEIVDDLMSKIVNIFILDIVLGQVDRTSANWHLIEDGEKADIGPVFDNSRIFFRLPIYSQMSMTVSSKERLVDARHTSLENNVMEFMGKSDVSFRKRLTDAVKVLEPKVVEDILSSIEKRTGYSISATTKSLYSNLCVIQKSFLESAFNEKPQEVPHF